MAEEQDRDITTTHFKTAEAFLASFSPWSYSSITISSSLFRGQSQDYPLIPSALRNNLEIKRSADNSKSLTLLVAEIEFPKSQSCCATRGFHLLANRPSSERKQRSIGMPLDSLFHAWLLDHEDRCNMYMGILNSSERRPMHQVTKFMEKYTLPCSEAIQGLHLLQQAGFDHAHLFPGYGGVVEHVRWRNAAMRYLSEKHA